MNFFGKNVKELPNPPLSWLGLGIGIFFFLARHWVALLIGGDVFSGEVEDHVPYWVTYDVMTNFGIIGFLKSLFYTTDGKIKGFVVNVILGLFYIDIVDRAFFSRYELNINDFIGWGLVVAAMWIKHKWEIVKIIVKLQKSLSRNE